MVGMLCSRERVEWRVSKRRRSEVSKIRREEGKGGSGMRFRVQPVCFMPSHTVRRQHVSHHTWGLICFCTCPSLSVSDSRIAKLVYDKLLAVSDSFLCAAFDRFPCTLFCPFSQDRPGFSLLEFHSAVYVNREIVHRIGERCRNLELKSVFGSMHGVFALCVVRAVFGRRQ